MPNSLSRAREGLEIRYDGILENAPCAIIIVTKEGIIATVNAAAEQMFGYDRDELVGEKLEILVPERLRKQHTMMRAGYELGLRAMGRGRDLVARRKDGTEFPAEIGLGAVLHDDGTMVAAFIADITERKRGAEIVRRYEQRYRALFEQASDAVFVLATDGRVQECNGNAERFLGIRQSEIQGHELSDFVVGPKDDEDHRLRFERLDSGSMRLEAERFLRVDREERIADVTGTPVMLDGERLVLVVARDVTSRNMLLEQLQVSDRMVTVGTLAAGIAHEINNPLAAIIGNLELLSRTLEDAGRSETSASGRAAHDQLADAREAAERVRLIVRDLRIFSRIDDDAREAVDVRLVLESCLRMASNEVRHRAHLVKDYGDVPRVNANESRLSQVFLNLVVNAAQAIPEGHADENEIRLTTRVDASGAVAVDIHDTGTGIAPDVLRRMFNPFFTTKPKGVGTGLGLSISRRIVDSLGGEIRASSTVGSGTTFTVLLPPACGDVEKPRPAKPPALVARRRGRVLVVEDEPILGAMIQRLLVPDHDVTVDTRADAALARFDAGERFDAIVCDLTMPQVSGMDFYAALVRIAPAQARRIVFLTGGAFTPRTREFLDETPNHRLDKPFEPQALRAVIHSLVGG